MVKLEDVFIRKTDLYVNIVDNVNIQVTSLFKDYEGLVVKD